MAGRMNLPPGFEIEEPGMMNIPAGFEIEEERPQIGGGNIGWGAQVFGKPLPGSGFEGRKTMWQAIKHGWEVGGMMAVEGLAGMVRMEAEISDPDLPRMAGPSYIPSSMAKSYDKSMRESRNARLQWSKDMLEAVDIAVQENPEVAMQLNEDDGFIDTTFDIVSHPEKLLQGIVEAVPLMAEAMLGTIVAGPVGGVTVMAQPFVGKTYGRARQEGTDVLPAFIQATLTGYGEAAIEQWTFSKKLGLARGFRKMVEKGGRKVIWEGTKLYGRGMAEEGSQQFNENLWRWVFTDRSQLLTEGVVQAMAVGGPLELTMGGAFAGAGYAMTPKQVPNSEKIKCVEALRNRANESSLSDDEKVELNKVFDQTLVDINDGKFDSGPVEIAAVAPPEAQIDAAETVITGQEALLNESKERQAARYEELLELVEQGDELAAQEIQEMTVGLLTPEQQTEYEELLKQLQEGDEEAAQKIQELTSDEQIAEQNLPAYEVLFEAMLEGDVAAATALLNGEYKAARAAIVELETEGRVDPTVLATDEQARNFATIKVHSLARLLGLKKKDRQQIQFDLIGQKSLKGMSLTEVKKVEDYFVAQAKERGLSTSTGKELAEVIKLHTTQKKVQALSGVKPAAWKRILQTPGHILNQFLLQSKRIERLLEALDGFTEGPIYNSIWKVVQTQLVNSRTSHNERVARFREALVDIMTPELQTDEGIAEASAMIQAEDAAAGKKAHKLSKRAVRKIVGNSLWAKYITGGKILIAEATEVDPELSLSPSERIGVYLSMKNENSLIHLREGNLAAFENVDMTIIKIVESMTEQERQIGDWILRDLEANFERANGAAKLGLGRDLEQQDNYFPIRVIDVTDIQKEDYLTLLEDKPRKPLAKTEPGEVKARKKGANRPLDLDSFSVYLNHLTRIEQFIHMAPVAKSVGKILNTKEFRQALNDTTAGHGTQILDKWLKNCIRGHAIERTTGFAAKTLLWMRQKGVLFALAGNIPSVTRQFLSGFNAAASHPTILANTMKYLMQSADPRFYNTLEQRMLDKSDVIKTRSFERELANVKYQAQAARVLVGKKEFSEKALAWQKWADRRTVTIAWNSFYDAALHSESVQKQFDLDGSEEAAVAYANKMIARTQPMGDVEHLPDFFTGGPIERLLSTFMNQVNNNWNFWAHDIYGMRKAGKISNKMVAYRILFSNILPAMMFGAISRGGPPDDWKDSMFDWAIYTISPVFLLGRIVTDALLGFAGGKTAVEDLLPSNFGKTLQALIKGQPKKAAVPALKTVGGLTGRIPNQAIRTGQGVYDLWTGETDDLRRLIYSDWSLTQYGWPEGADEGRKPIQR